jgi:hypothetical protein
MATDEEMVKQENVMQLKDELLETLNKFALRNPDLDNNEVLFACLTLMGQVVANMKDPHHRQNAIDDVNGWSGKMMQVAARIAEGDAEFTEH